VCAAAIWRADEGDRTCRQTFEVLGQGVIPGSLHLKHRAPIPVKTIFQKIVEINKSLGITILLVEQNVNLALEVSHYGYVLETGRIILHDPSSALRTNNR
jgi:hypothetical protein